MSTGHIYCLFRSVLCYVDIIGDPKRASLSPWLSHGHGESWNLSIIAGRRTVERLKRRGYIFAAINDKAKW